jgi:hypothetical protein
MQNKLSNKPLKEKIKILEDNNYFNIYNDNLLLPNSEDVTDSIINNIKIIENRTNNIIDRAFSTIWS